MQLRVARLCLDCEELHTDNHCPRCASERYAFLSGWLPSEERRRWRRPPAPVPSSESSGIGGLARGFGRWLRGGKAAAPLGPATRASDYAAQLKFEEPDERPARRGRVGVHLSKNDVR